VNWTGASGCRRDIFCGVFSGDGVQGGFQLDQDLLRRLDLQVAVTFDVYAPCGTGGAVGFTSLPGGRAPPGTIWHVQSPIDPLVTERLRIREAVLADSGLFVRLFTDPVIRTHLGGPAPSDQLDEKVKGMHQRGVFVVEVAGAASIGVVTIGRHRVGDLELSYQFLPEYWDHGYAREACAAVLDWAFRDVADGGRIIAVTQVANLASVALLERLGMVEVDRFEEFGEPQVMMALESTPGA
jgi:RimJ/RimL family protein N-acetyltransferase